MAVRDAENVTDMLAAARLVRARQEALAPGRETRGLAGAIKHVVVILSSSRGGSSLLFQLLRSTGCFVSLAGEHTHLYKLFGLGLPSSPGAHDGSIDTDHADTEGFASALIGDPTTRDTAEPGPPDQFIPFIAKRLYVQWHAILPAPVDLFDHIARGMSSQAHHRGMHPEDLLLGIIRDLRSEGVEVNPWYYDISHHRLETEFPEVTRPKGPPELPVLLEEPPFVIPRPGLQASLNDIAERPLLLKASIDAYRFTLVRQIFPAARLTVIHLVRNPAAAINGLIDGWLDRGFFSHRLASPGPLAIHGYSDQSWGENWWNFDLPPSWESVMRRPLPSVCAFQWCSAHRAILQDVHSDNVRYIRVYAEELMFNRHERTTCIYQVLKENWGRSGSSETPKSSADDGHSPPASWTLA